MLRDRKDIGQRIRAARQKKKMTQKDLAEKVGTSVSRVSDWERGARKPTDEQKDKIVQTLGGTMYSYFFER